MMRRKYPTCDETVMAGDRTGEACGRPARYALATPYQQGFVCGNHRKAWLDIALFYLEPVPPRPAPATQEDRS